MIGHDPDFIRNRIEWRADQLGMPYEHTDFWDDAPPELQESLPRTLERPVVFSTDGRCGTTIIGTEEILIITEAGEERFAIDDIVDIAVPEDERRKEKTALDAICVKTAAGIHRLPAERGKGSFAIWSILLMLNRMQRRDNKPA